MRTPHVDYLLHLADNALILGQRNAEWCGHGPVLEQDIAISNIALDQVGQARMFYQYAAELMNKASGRTDITEDTLAYLRDTIDFKNLLLAEQPNGDWAVTILRQFFCSTWQYYLYSNMQQSSDVQLAAIAAQCALAHIVDVKDHDVRLAGFRQCVCDAERQQQTGSEHPGFHE